ncbi:Subtilisin-like protease 10 [Beauveria bassiana]|nr:Subtilisin-like protease 10 [Beauveria bassiana]KAH8716625.1 Subtilisin-like protease 10 [Beauveria bassiana]
MFVGKPGQGITVYVLNSGIRVTSPELDGRATFGANFVDNNDHDQLGYGTEVARVIVSNYFGASKSVDLVAVKVVADDGMATTFSVLQGAEYVFNEVARKEQAGRAFVHIPLASTVRTAVADAIEELKKAGIALINDDEIVGVA